MGRKARDITGQRFGRLVVLEKAEPGARGSPRWLCKCNCGNTTTVYWVNLKSGKTRSCKCLMAEETGKRARARFTIDETGNRYGRLVVIERRFGPKGQYGARWLCRCDCGTERVISRNLLRYRGTRSCGCIGREKNAALKAEAAAIRKERGERIYTEWKTGKYKSQEDLAKYLNVSPKKMRKLLGCAGYNLGKEAKEERDKRIADSWEAGEYHTRRELAEGLNIPKNVVYRILRGRGPSGKYRKTQEEIQRRNELIVDMWHEGTYSDTDLAEVFHLSHNRIHEILNKHSALGTMLHKINRNARVRELWRQGICRREIAEMFSIREETVTTITRGIERIREVRTRICPSCGTEFEPDRRESRFCSNKCSHEYLHQRAKERHELIRGLSYFGVPSADIAPLFNVTTVTVASIINGARGGA